MPRVRALLAAFALLLAACGPPIETATTTTEPAASKGPRFDLVTPADEPFIVRSKDVEIGRTGRALVLHFPALIFERTLNASAELTLSTLSVRLIHPDHPEADKQQDADLLRVALTKEKGMETIRDVRVKLDDAADECTRGCSLFITIYYSFLKSPTQLTSSGVGSQVDVNLSANTAQVRSSSPPSGTTEVAKKQSNPCPYPIERISEALGQPMRYRTPGADYDCATVPESGELFNVAVLSGTKYYDGLSISSDAQPVSLGDRAMFLPGIATVCAVRGPWTVAVQIGENQNPAPPTEQTRRRAEAIARKVIDKLAPL